MPLFIQLPGKLQRLLHPRRRFRIQPFCILIHPHGKLHHALPVRNGPGGIPMHHDIVFVPGLFPDQFQQPLGVLQVSRIGVDENGAVSVSFGRIHIKLRHLIHVKLFL